MKKRKIRKDLKKEDLVGDRWKVLWVLDGQRVVLENMGGSTPIEIALETYVYIKRGWALGARVAGRSRWLGEFNFRCAEVWACGLDKSGL